MRAASAYRMLVALPRNRIPRHSRVAALRVADLEIDALHPRIRQGSREIALSPSEHILLYTLAARRGAVLSYRELANALGWTAQSSYNNALARHISTLRGKLEDDAQRPRYIATVPGVGFRFVAAAQTSDEAPAM